MPRGSISDEKGIDKIGEEGGRGGERLHPDLTFVFGPRTPILKKNTWTFLHFFFKRANFFMNAAPTLEIERREADNTEEHRNRRHLRILPPPLIYGLFCGNTKYFPPRKNPTGSM